MRDVKAGRDINVSGDIVINDESTQIGKLYIHCSNAELIEERSHRKLVLDKARKRKLGLLGMVCVFLIFIWLGFFIYFYWIDKSEFALSLLTVGSLAVGVMSLKVTFDNTEFERRQLDALKEIAYLLHERGDQ